MNDENEIDISKHSTKTLKETKDRYIIITLALMPVSSLHFYLVYKCLFHIPVFFKLCKWSEEHYVSPFTKDRLYL